MDQQAELIKIAAFYDELEKIAAQNPELYELLKEAGLWSGVAGLARGASRGLTAAGKGLAKGTTTAGRGLATAGRSVAAVPGRLSDAANMGVIKAQNAMSAGVHRLPKSVRGPVHTGMHAGADAMGHAMSSSIDPSTILSHGAEFGALGMGAHALGAGARAAAPHVSRAAKSVAGGAKNLVGKLKMPNLRPPGGMAPAMAGA